MPTVATCAARVTIREATLADVNAIVAMGGRFLASTSYRGKISDVPEQRARVAITLIESEDGVVLVAQETEDELVGFLAMFIYQHPLSGQTFAAELAWWVEPDHRGRVGLQLLSQGEAWAKHRGAEVIQMVAPIPEVERLYERRGYAPVERHYHKSVRG